MLITFGITQNQEPIQNLLKGGKGIFFFTFTYKDNSWLLFFLLKTFWSRK